MKNSTNKIKILKTLLESPKTTGQIAIALDYKDNKGHGIYKNIISDLKTLGQYGFIYEFKSNKKTVGAPPTTYDIVYSIEKIAGILQKYPSLSLHLYNNEKVGVLLANNLYLDVQKTYPNLASNEEFMDEINHLSKLLLKTQTGFNLMLSTNKGIFSDRLFTVFRNSIDGTQYEYIDELYKEMINECNWSIGDCKKVESFEKTTIIGGLTIEERDLMKSIKFFNDTIYEACIFSDILNGVYNGDAIEYIHKKNKRKFEYTVDFIYSAFQHDPTPPNPDHSKAAVKHSMAESLQDMNWSVIP